MQAFLPIAIFCFYLMGKTKKFLFEVQLRESALELNLKKSENE